MIQRLGKLMTNNVTWVSNLTSLPLSFFGRYGSHSYTPYRVVSRTEADG